MPSVCFLRFNENDTLAVYFVRTTKASGNTMARKRTMTHGDNFAITLHPPVGFTSTTVGSASATNRVDNTVTTDG